MADERVTRGSAGPAQRQPRRRAGLAAAEAGARPDLNERERNVSPRRKAMGPVTPPESSPGILPADQAAIPEVPPTDPQ